MMTSTEIEALKATSGPPGAQPTDRRAVDGPPPTAMIQLADTTRARKGASL